MNTSARPVRTYSRRQSTKRTDTASSSISGRSGRIASSRLSDDDEPPRKRRTFHKDSYDANDDPGAVVPLEYGTSNSHGSLSNLPTRESSLVEDDGRLQKRKEKEMNRHLDSTNDGISLSAILRNVSPSQSDSSTSLLRTPKRPKDLSGIFEAASPQRRSNSNSQDDWSHSSPGKPGITKKMLPRSKTESSIDSSPSRTARLTPKSQSFNLPRKNEQSSLEVRSESCSPRNQSSRELSIGSIASGSQQGQREGATSTRTYAGKSRSFLVALPTSALPGQSGNGIKQDFMDNDDEEYLRDSYAELRKRYGVDNSEGVDPDLGDDGSTGEGLALYNPLSSITDLRSKGESRRFRDEMGYLFEGLQPSGSPNVRRSSAFDIVSKLSDQEFWRKAKAAGLTLEIWERLRGAGAGDGDKVLDTVLCYFVSLASEDSRDIALLSRKEDFVETVVRLLATHATNDPLIAAKSSKGVKLSKAEILTLNRLHGIMSAKTDIVQDNCQPSTRLLLSCALSTAPSLAFPHLSVILGSAIGDLATISSRLAAYKSGLPLLIDPVQSHEKFCLEHVYNCLAILDLYLIEAEASGNSLRLSKTELRKQFRSLPSGLVALLAITDIISRTNLAEHLQTQVSRCSELVFRILINLTNGSPTWSDAIVADPYAIPTTIRLVMTSHRSVLSLDAKKAAVDPMMHDQVATPMDRLCLALALLTNLLQERDNLAYSLQDIMFDVECKEERACLLGCRCANSTSAVSNLVHVYISFMKDGEEDLVPDFLFLRGHLAVLIGLLLLQLHSSSLQNSTPDSSPPSSESPSQVSSASPSHSIITSLPGPPNSNACKLDALIANVDAFSQLYASLTSKVRRNSMTSVDRDEPTSDGFDSTQRRLGSSSASDIVASVAASLRTLRPELCNY